MKPFVPALVVFAFGAACSPSKPPATGSTPPPPLDLAGFRSWKRVTRTPFPMNEATAMLCIGYPALNDAYARKTLVQESPHWNHYVHVYVNDKGFDAMMHRNTSLKSIFPIGSIIVKEKFPGKSLHFGKPTVLTVMRKRESGFDTVNGDWEYFIGDPKASRAVPVSGEKLQSCQSCHEKYKDRDFVTKAYLLTYEDMSQAWQRRAKQLPQPR